MRSTASSSSWNGAFGGGTNSVKPSSRSIGGFAGLRWITRNVLPASLLEPVGMPPSCFLMSELLMIPISPRTLPPTPGFCAPAYCARGAPLRTAFDGAHRAWSLIWTETAWQPPNEKGRSFSGFGLCRRTFDVYLIRHYSGQVCFCQNDS